MEPSAKPFRDSDKGEPPNSRGMVVHAFQWFCIRAVDPPSQVAQRPQNVGASGLLVGGGGNPGVSGGSRRPASGLFGLPRTGFVPSNQPRGCFPWDDVHRKLVGPEALLLGLAIECTP